jgi:hypothetical protein
MGMSINILHSKALIYFLPVILPLRNNTKTIPVSPAAREMIHGQPLEPQLATVLGERPDTGE